MRDNHSGMPEIIDAFEEGDKYNAVVEIVINGINKKFQFGVTNNGYRALKSVLQTRPFDTMPGLKYRYFFTGSYFKGSDDSACGMDIRVEQDKNGINKEVRVPKDLLANLIWFSKITDFDEAKHLPEIK